MDRIDEAGKIYDQLKASNLQPNMPSILAGIDAGMRNAEPLIRASVLKEVAEWLEEECDHLPLNPCKRYRCGVCLEQLKQGKLEEK